MAVPTPYSVQAWHSNQPALELQQVGAYGCCRGPYLAGYHIWVGGGVACMNRR